MAITRSISTWTSPSVTAGIGSASGTCASRSPRSRCRARARPPPTPTKSFDAPPPGRPQWRSTSDFRNGTAMPLSNLAIRDIETLAHPNTNLALLRDTGPLVIERGKGVFVYDTEGKAYLEGMAGLWCAALGYGNAELAETAAAEMRKLGFGHLYNGKSHDPAIELAEKLKEIAPVPISKVFFCNSGSEANDTQIKLVRYMNNALGRPNKKKVVGRMKGFHGLTIGAASLTGLPHNHADFDLPIPGIFHLSCPHHYRVAQDGESEEDFATRLAAELGIDPARGARHGRGLRRRARDGGGWRDRAAKNLFREDRARVRGARRLHDLRRGDLRLRAARPQFRLRGARLPAACAHGREGPVLGLSADRRRDDAGGDVPGAAVPEPKARRLPPWIYLFGPSGGGGGGRQDPGDLRARQGLCGRGGAHAAVPAASQGARRASAGRGGARARPDGRHRARRRQENQAGVRSQATRRPALRAPRRRGGIDRARGGRRHHHDVPAAGHHGGRDRRAVRAAFARARSHPRLGSPRAAARGLIRQDGAGLLADFPRGDDAGMRRIGIDIAAPHGAHRTTDVLVGFVRQVRERHAHAPVRRVEPAAVEQHHRVVLRQLVHQVERMDVLLEPGDHAVVEILAQPELEIDRSVIGREVGIWLDIERQSLQQLAYPRLADLHAGLLIDLVGVHQLAQREHRHHHLLWQ